MHDDIARRVNDASIAALSEPPRTHLGASQIGRECMRAIWYSFRWVSFDQPQGRMLRLWNRGHEEEHRLSRWLREAGAEIRDRTQRLIVYTGAEGTEYRDIDWDAEIPPYFHDVSHCPEHLAVAALNYGIDLQQWGFQDFYGHFAGSNDGKIRWPGVLPEGWGGVEYKTHNNKSFTALRNKGVAQTKPIHVVQMNVYMHYLKLPWCLYVAVNKDNDELYFEVVKYDTVLALKAVATAAALIRAKDAPRRINEDPSFHVCRYCTHREPCHYDSSACERNCRSCAFAQPVENKGWRCNHYHQPIPQQFIAHGCDRWAGVA